MTPEQMNKFKPGSALRDPDTGEWLVEGLDYEIVTFGEALKAMTEGKIVRSDKLFCIYRQGYADFDQENKKLQFQMRSHGDWLWIGVAQFFEEDLTKQWYILKKDNPEKQS